MLVWTICCLYKCVTAACCKVEVSASKLFPIKVVYMLRAITKHVWQIESSAVVMLDLSSIRPFMTKPLNIPKF
eukprot:137803-Pleurochrysis_carterae.AAC.2